jgi:hypothetical protein
MPEPLRMVAGQGSRSENRSGQRGSGRAAGDAAVNQADLQRLAQERVRDASILLAGGQWPGASYLAGYAVECGLKSCVLHHIEKTGMLFRDRKYLNKLADCWSHDLDKLLDLAGLTAELGITIGANPTLQGHWGAAKDWKETSRYELKTEVEARTLYEAVTHDPDGVLKWIQIHW